MTARAAVAGVPVPAEEAFQGAVAAFNEGRFPEAVRSLTELLPRTVRRGSVLYFRAIARQSAGETDLAAADLRAALAAEPRSPALGLAAATAFASLGRRREALSACRRASGRGARDLEASLRLAAAQELAQAGRLEKALSECARAAQLSPSAQAFELRHKLELALGRRGPALRSLSRALDLGQGTALAWERRHELELALGRRELAWRSLSRAVRLEPGSARLRLAAAELLRGLGREREALAHAAAAAAAEPGSLEAWAVKRQLELALGASEKALASLRRELELSPQSGELWEQRARLARSLGRREEALEDLARAQAAGPGRAAPRLAAAELLLELGRTEEAAARCAEALALSPRDASAWALRAALTRAAGDREAALAAYEKALSFRPREGAWRLAAAGLLAGLGRLPEALAQCRRAAAAGSLDALAVRGELEAELGRGAAARAAFLSAARARGAGAELLLRAAAGLEAGGDFEAARLCLERARQVEPGAARPRLVLARLALWAGRLERASRLAGEALARDPSLGEAWRIRGAAAALSGRHARALEELDAALSRDPRDVEAWVWKAESLRRRGRLREALRALERADAMGFLPGNGWNKALARLALGLPLDEHADALLRLCPPPARPRLAAAAASGSREGVARAIDAALALMGGNRTSRVTYLRRGRLAAHEAKDPRALMKGLQRLVLQGRAAEALKRIDRLLAAGGADEGMLLAHRGEVKLWLGRGEEAVRDLEAALAADPLLRWPHAGICGAYALRGERDKAVEHARLALSVSRADERALWVFLGEAHWRAGDPREALKALVKEEKSANFRPAAWVLLALARGDAGDLKRQRAGFERLRALLPAFLRDAAREAGEAGPPPGEPWRDAALRRVLEKALELLRGNRSAWMHAYFLGDGSVRVIEPPSGHRPLPL